MKKTLTALALCAFGLAQFSANAQEYDLNKYKYRFQQYRGLTGGFRLDGDGDLSTTKYSDNDTIPEYSNIQDYNTRGFDYRFNLNYFTNISLDNLQRGTSLTLNSSAEFGQNGSGRKLNDSLLNSSYNKYSSYQQSLDFNQFNRFYKPNNSFTYLEYGARARIDGARNFNNESKPGDTKNNQNRNQIGANLNIGKGKGRIENVSDAVLAMFIIKDLQKKGGLGKLTDAQTELIAQGITTARNRRFIDFRFRTIDQIALLDSFFTAAGAKPPNDLIYYTTLYDNWFYATEFSRGTGKRFTYYLSNEAGYSAQQGTRENSIGTDYNYQKYTGTSLFNAINLDYINSKQLNLYHERSFSISIKSGLNHRTSINEFKDSLNLARPYSENSSKSKDGDAINSSISGVYSHLYQPNTRTYLRWSVEGYYQQNNSMLGLRTANPTKENNIAQLLSSRFNLDFFHFFSPRLSVYGAAGVNAYANLNTEKREIAYAPNNLFNFKSNNNGITGGVTLSAGLNYALF